MSAKTRRPKKSEMLVRVKDMMPVLDFINALQKRIAKLEEAQGGAASLPDGGYIPTTKEDA